MTQATDRRKVLDMLVEGKIDAADADADRVELLAWVGSAPVMGTIEFGRARILFLGDVNIVQRVPRPFVDHLVTWLVL